MATLLPYRGTTPVELAMVIVFGVLFAWISVGFWESAVGFFSLLCRYDRFSISSKTAEPDVLKTSDARTAVLMPIYNEDVRRVFTGLRLMYLSLQETNCREHFDFFILSDTTDPDVWIKEEIAWADICSELNAAGHIYYRHRRPNLKGKSGNIADFCRRWGSSYRYMVVLDADSIMTGTGMVQLVALMERHEQVGILQTVPKAVNRETLLARAHQFANHVYGPISAAGLNWIQLGDSHYWGHNAVIRVEPFMQHCSLPNLSGKPPRGGTIISHDFVEAAFMRRGGWEVWLVYDLEGSYEEVPPTLLDELRRDRRWCQGNLQHIRLLLTRGLFSAHRVLFLHGVMSYVSSLLWLLFLVLSSINAIVETFRQPVYFTAERALFPDWPIWHFYWAFTLLATTLVILFLPRIFGLLLIATKSDWGKGYGGLIRLFVGLVAETLVSMLVAPVRMLFHSKFVLLTLLGRQIQWGVQQRGDYQTPWLEALWLHGAGSGLAFVWGTVLFLVNRPFFWWNLPVLLPLFLSIPISVLSSYVSLGQRARRRGIFNIPEESAPPPILAKLTQMLQQKPSGSCSCPGLKTAGFISAVVDPQVNILHRSLLRHERTLKPSIVAQREAMMEKALSRGPQSLTEKEKTVLLLDSSRLTEMHRRVWENSDSHSAASWGMPTQTGRGM
jgi:membrane glycosyltransferase